MNYKPMLAVDCGGIESVRFPVIASPKLDGVRAIITHEGVLSRTLKPIPNKRVQSLLDGLPVGLDGELLAGVPCAPDVYRKTVSMVMADDADITGLKYYVFDVQIAEEFTERLRVLDSIFARLENTAAIELVSQIPIETPEGLAVVESEWVGLGYEGAILRSPASPYKHGRSTKREGYLLKLKRFVDSEAEVIGVTELMHNGNEATVNELGRTARSSHKAGKTGMGVLGALVVRDERHSQISFEVGTGFTAVERSDYFPTEPHQIGWTDDKQPIYDAEVYKGALAKYKFFAGGSKDKPRFPVFLGWRDKRDV